jgi:hypothetical protein
MISAIGRSFLSLASEAGEEQVERPHDGVAVGGDVRLHWPDAPLIDREELGDRNQEPDAADGDLRRHNLDAINGAGPDQRGDDAQTELTRGIVLKVDEKGRYRCATAGVPMNVELHQP